MTDSEGDTACDTMIVTVEELSKRHPDIPVGMMGIQYRTSSDLARNFRTIYEGDSSVSHPACNHLHTYGYDFDTIYAWGLQHTDASKSRAEKHAIAWASYVKAVSFANNWLGGPKLKCLISKPLTDLSRHKPTNWNSDEFEAFVRQTIHMIDEGITPTRRNPNPKDIVAGWYLADDALDPRDEYTADEILAVVEAVHCAQKACGVNWPFYFSDNVDADIFWNSSNTKVVIPNMLKKLVGGFPDDATPIFMPYYYPWLSGNWNYTEFPPWKKWKLYIEKLHGEFFPSNAEAIHDNLKFHPILDASEKLIPSTGANKVSANLPLPGHADMHKQIRVVWNLLQEYNSVTGIWLLGWDVDDGVALQRATAHNNWTENRKWAEAIQNEPHETEGIREAIPDVSEVHSAYTTADSDVTGKRIPYSLSERKRFEIRIYNDNIVENPNAKLVRTLDEGYDDDSPQGVYRNPNFSGRRYEDLRGTSAYWDLKRNPTDDRTVNAGEYFVYLYVDGTRAAGHQTITIEEED